MTGDYWSPYACNPGPYAGTIAQLREGDEVVILKGGGTPPKDRDTTAIIARVRGCSALTADGTVIDCHHEIQPTGEHYKNFLLGPRARTILSDSGLE